MTHMKRWENVLDMFPNILMRLKEDYQNEILQLSKPIDLKLQTYKVLILSPPPMGEGGPSSNEWKLV